MAKTVYQRKIVQSELVEQGPLVGVLFSPHPADGDILAIEGSDWQPIPHQMMVDTGAAVTVVEDAVPRFLGLEPIRFQEIAGVTGNLDCPVYRLQIEIRSSDRTDGVIQFLADVVAVPPVPELARPHVGLLGRDFLQFGRFEYDGPSGMYQLIDESR